MHNAAFEKLGLDWAYLPLPVHPDGINQALKGLVALNFRGCNVTVPHKESVISYLDQVDDVGRIIGAVNSIRVEDGKLLGSNTDPYGFLMALKEANIQPEGMQVLVLGAGGAARAVVFALGQAGARSIFVVNRHPERATKLVKDLAESHPESELSYGSLDARTLNSWLDEIDLVVNSTSVGMYPKVDACPWPEQLPLYNRAVYFDLIYNPLRTQLMERADTAGADSTNGLEMLIHQGAKSFKTWTGQQAPIAVMRRACLDQLGDHE
jgi:shikimate dehydrogenase